MTSNPLVGSEPTIALRGRGVQIADVVAVARHRTKAFLTDDARAAMAKSAALVEGFVASEHPVYGVTTGFGSLAATVIPSGRTAELQVALIAFPGFPRLL